MSRSIAVNLESSSRFLYGSNKFSRTILRPALDLNRPFSSFTSYGLRNTEPVQVHVKTSTTPLADALRARNEKPKHKIVVDTELPDVSSKTPRLMLYYSAFFGVIAFISYGFFNYERQQSPVVSSTMYTARRSPTVHKYLGSNIRFRDPFPWIYGDINTVRGFIDFEYIVIGSKNVPARIHFSSSRPKFGEPFEMTAWELKLEDGTVVDLMDEDDLVGDLTAFDIDENDSKLVK
ncbi:cytochrome oxidase complex assembly protein 1-domain-containing protein [Lipomyces oligophaga]|uniref:cytochrome oxidase complex assembly protein 1-domain-containing protein n=1 Tax=Lipomyces oligophaga TaxID=45792 RepID=UPI0034CDB8BC